jgi:two-component system chemotaxis response regulator CheB
VTEPGDPSLFTYPECPGARLQLQDERPIRNRCHTGYAFTANTLLAELSDATEEANAIRSIEESAMLMRHLANHWQNRNPLVADQFLRNVKTVRGRGDFIRQAVGEY